MSRIRSLPRRTMSGSRTSPTFLALSAIVGLGIASPLFPQESGVPTYPGARYDAPRSARISTPHEKYFIYTTRDSLPKVIAFYEARTGLGARPVSQGAVLIALKGNPPFPDHGIVIEPNRPEFYPADVSTVVTVFRVTGPREPVASVVASGAPPQSDSAGAARRGVADSEPEQGRQGDGRRYGRGGSGGDIRLPRAGGLKHPERGGGRGRGGHAHFPGRD